MTQTQVCQYLNPTLRLYLYSKKSSESGVTVSDSHFSMKPKLGRLRHTAEGLPGDVRLLCRQAVAKAGCASAELRSGVGPGHGPEVSLPWSQGMVRRQRSDHPPSPQRN